MNIFLVKCNKNLTLIVSEAYPYKRECFVAGDNLQSLLYWEDNYEDSNSGKIENNFLNLFIICDCLNLFCLFYCLFVIVYT